MSGGVAVERIRAALRGLTADLEARGLPSSEWSGKLIRPLVGYAAAGAPAVVEEGPLLYALAAVQLAHEASLVHDDVLDGASERRGEATVAAARGVAAALVEGDHLLTASYRLAARTDSLDYADLFARAVERTVAGEKAQARSAGRPLDWSEYEAIVLGKSGELLGASLAAAATLRGDWEAHRHYEVGRRIGLVYQMLDDLLDYCPHVSTGKPALGDYARGLWTWPLAHIDLPHGQAPEEAARRLAEPGPDGRSALDRCLEQFRAEAAAVAAEVRALLPSHELVVALLDGWVATAESAVAQSRAAAALPPVEGWEQLMAEHARSFRFAAHLFPGARREQVMGVYAWCRYTDDLVDGVDLPPRLLEARLDAWLELSRRAYAGERTGNALADRVMAEMAAAGVPFGYAEALVEGMRMDVRGTGYETMTELWTYTYRVAGVVGLWLTELFGIRDPWMLDRATSLGHAMQLTNILRDVGEDLAAGRVYIPRSWLSAYGLDRTDLERMARTGTIEPSYRELMARLIEVAEEEYDIAFAAIPRLPDSFRRPVAVAAEVYRGIHASIREHDYDNLSRRAYTTLPAKLRFGARGLWRSRSETPLRGLARAALFGLVGIVATAGVGVRPLPAAAQTEAGAPAAGPATATPPPEVRLAAPGVAQSRAPAAPVARVAGVAPLSEADRTLAAVHRLWLLAVDDADATAEGLRVTADLLEDPGPASPRVGRLLRAYAGSFTALRAKHASWPPARLRDLRAGFRILDAAVAEAPSAPELRYVRLMSGFYLPSLFGRGDEVDADLAALVRLLPGNGDRFAPGAFPDAVAFVLAHARMEEGARRRLEEAGPG